MKRYEQKITEVGLNKGTVSTKIKNMIREFKGAEQELAEIEAEFEKTTDEDEKQALKARIDEYKQTLEEVEDEIIVKIEDFARKKPMFDENIKRMQDARKAKIAERNGVAAPTPAPAQNEPTPAPVAATEPTPAPVAAAPVAAAQPEVISVEAEEVKEEKKKSGGGMIFAGILTVAAILIGVNFVRNRN